MKQVLIYALAVVTVLFIAVWYQTARRHRPGENHTPDWLSIDIGFLTNYLDTLGISSFATTTSLFKFKGSVNDEDIPGTLNVGHAIPTFAQAFIYMTFVDVDAVTLVTLIGASVLGAWLGAGFVSSWSRRMVQIWMGGALLVAASLLVMKHFQLLPGGGDALGLSGQLLAVAVVGNFILGALMSLGIGLYAPCMIMVALLGMNPKAAFPIMMGSCAFLMPAGSLAFFKSERYDLRAAIGLTIGGLPGVLLAAFLIKELPLSTMRMLVIVVVLYTAIMMLTSAARESNAAAQAPAVERETAAV